MARKLKNLRKVKKNRYGCPTVLIRENVPGGTVHISANMSWMEATFRPTELDGKILTKLVHWTENMYAAEQLYVRLDKFVDAIREKGYDAIPGPAHEGIGVLV